MESNYPHFDSSFVQGLYDWQTMIGAAIALVGAAILLCQIRQGDRHEQERRRRRFVAARAGMPLLLSAICDYAREVASFLRAIHGPAGQHGFGAPNLAQTTPRLPRDLSTELQSLIEASPDNSLATRIARLLGELQVMNSRIADIPNMGPYMTGLQRTIEDYLLQAAGIYADASSLYDFARSEVDQVELCETVSVRSALNLLELRDHEFPNLHATANRRERQRAGPPSVAAGPQAEA